MTAISKKKEWISTDAWRGHYQFIDAVAGANDTGSWSDSPCPTHVREYEMAQAIHLLRKAKIKYKTAWCESSNCFMQSQNLLVAPADRAKAIEILKPLEKETWLLWVEKK